MQQLHLGQFGQRPHRHAGRLRAALHLPDGDVHPDERGDHDAEHQPEAALPDAGQVIERTERDRQHEAAQATDHSDHAAHRADAVGIINRDVLEDRCGAEAHEEAEHEGDGHEAEDAERGAERHRPVDALHHVLGRRIRQDERARGRDAERPVHEPARTELVGEVAAIGAEDRRRNREQRAEHAGGPDVDAVDADQVARQPQRQRDEAAEDEEVVEREPPHLHVGQRGEHRPDRLGFRASRAAAREIRIVLRQQEEGDARCRQYARPNESDGLPAIDDHHRWRGEYRDCRADIARAEDA